MGIVYLEPSKHKYKKLRRVAFTYTMIMQMIFTIVGLALLGYFIGDKFYPDTDIDLILTGIGTILGFVVSVMYFIQFIKREELYEKHRND